MKESIFTRLMGLGGEDITTELLTFMLNQEEYKHIKIMILNIMLRIEIDEIEEYKIGTQKIYEKGRPDIIIENDEKIILIENKFYAEFSGGDQIKRYVDILETDKDHKKKKLILLTIKNRKDYLIQRIKEQLLTDNIEQYFNTINTDFEILLWNDILELIESNDIITKELKKFIYENYIINTEIGGIEMELLNNSKIPELMEKIWNTISGNRIFMEKNGYKVGRMSQSRTSYFYYLEFTWGMICIQYFHDFWKEYETPFSIQLMDDWNTGNINLEKLEDFNFKKNENYQYIFPISIEGKDLQDDFNEKVFNKIKYIREIFGV